MMKNQFRNRSGKMYSEGDWLDNHHSIKSRLRSELVQNLPLKSGSNILDIGCGTGIWVSSIAEKLGHTGFIRGIDSDADAIAVADRRRENHLLKDCICFECVDIAEYKPTKKYDAVLLFNTLSYLPSPETLLGRIPEFLGESGTLIIKDSDLASDFFWPVDVKLYHSLMSSIETLQTTRDIGLYDPFFARKIPRLLRECGFIDINVTTQSFSFSYPVDDRQKKYIAGNGKMISNYASLAGITDAAKKWASQFDCNQTDTIFNDPNFLYSMTEFIFQARVPIKS